MASVDERDTVHLRRAMALARKSRERGDDPFGAVLVDKDGRVLAEGLNTETTGRDVTGHAETNLIRAASQSVDAETFASSSLYASGEPCAMCSAASFSSSKATPRLNSGVPANAADSWRVLRSSMFTPCARNRSVTRWTMPGWSDE